MLVLAGCLLASLAATGPAASAPTFRAQWPGANGGFANPVDLATDPAGNVYVADTGNDRVQAYGNSGAFHGQWGTPGTGSGELDGPTGIALGPQELIYVVDTGNERVQIFDATGAFGDLWGSPGTAYGEFDGPFGVTTSAAGNVYVTDPGNDRVQRFTPTGGVVAPPSEWSAGTDPRGIELDAAGSVYVVDAGADVVRKFDPAGNPVAAFGSFGPAGTLDDPTGIAADPDGDLYVADTGNDRVLHITSSGALIEVVGGPGPGQGTFLSPTGLDTDCRGNLFVVDQGHGVVQKLGVPAPPPPCDDPPDPEGLLLELNADPRQKVKHLRATLTCPLESCRVGVGGRVKGRSRARLIGQVRELEASQPQTVAIDYEGKNTVRRLRQALRKRKAKRRARVDLAAEATDSEGTVVVEQLTVKLRR
jgi:DNA-binding beta-propeller fold protein YncE